MAPLTHSFTQHSARLCCVLATEFGEGGMMAPTHGWQHKRLEAITRVFGKKIDTNASE